MLSKKLQNVKFLKLAYEKDGEKIKELIEDFSDINASDGNLGQTPLMYCVMTGNKIAVDELLKHEKIDVNYKLGTNQKGAIHYAAEFADYDENVNADVKDPDTDPKDSDKKQETIIEALIKAGANINEPGVNGRTPIYFAIANNQKQGTKYLIERDDIDLFVQDTKDLKTPLHLLAKMGDVENVAIFLTKIKDDKEKVQLHDREGRNALHIASRNGQVGVVEELVNSQLFAPSAKKAERHHDASDHAGKNKVDNEMGFNAMHYAAKGGHQKVVEKLYSADNSLLEDRDSFQRTPLMVAALYGHDKVVGWLADQGANVKCTDGGNKSALDYAISKRHSKVRAELIKRGALATKSSDTGKLEKNELHEAVDDCDADAIEDLVNGGISVDSRDEDGETALHYAARNRDLASIEKLITLKADVNIQNSDGDVPLHVAFREFADVKRDVEDDEASSEDLDDARECIEALVNVKGVKVTVENFKENEEDKETPFGLAQKYLGANDPLFLQIKQMSNAELLANFSSWVSEQPKADSSSSSDVDTENHEFSFSVDSMNTMLKNIPGHDPNEGSDDDAVDEGVEVVVQQQQDEKRRLEEAEKQRQEEERKRLEEEEKRRLEEEERKRLEEEKLRQFEKEQLRLAAEERKQREEEQKRLEQEEKRRLEAEQKRLEEVKRRLEEEARKRAEEEERKRLEEEKQRQEEEESDESTKNDSAVDPLRPIPERFEQFFEVLDKKIGKFKEDSKDYKLFERARDEFEEIVRTEPLGSEDDVTAALQASVKEWRDSDDVKGTDLYQVFWTLFMIASTIPTAGCVLWVPLIKDGNLDFWTENRLQHNLRKLDQEAEAIELKSG